MNEKQNSNSETGAHFSKQKLANVIEISPRIAARRAAQGAPVQQVDAQTEVSRPKPASGSNVVHMQSWKERLGKAIVGEDIKGLLNKEGVEGDAVPQPRATQIEERTFQKKQPDTFNERIQKNNTTSIETVDEKIKAVQRCVYIEELIEEYLPRIGIVSSDRGVFSPQDLKEILYKAYSGKVSLDEVPLTYGIRAKVIELMKKNGLVAYGAGETKPSQEVVQESVKDVPLSETVEDQVDTSPESTDPQLVPQEKVVQTSEAWRETRDQYRAYREKVKNAEKVFLEKSEAFEDERRNTGVLARLMATPELDELKKEMLKAQFEYDTLLEGLRSERQKRMTTFVEKQRAKNGFEDSEGAIKSAEYVARHEAMLEHHINSEVQMLESLRYQENEKGESRFRLVRGMKAGFNWYRTLPLKKRLMLGAGIGAVVGGALGASGIVAGGALVAGGAMATRRAVGGFLGSIIALETKRAGDQLVEFIGNDAMSKEHEAFTEKKLSESRGERLAIKKKIRIGKHAATAGAGVAAVLTGAGVANASHNIIDAIGIAEVEAGQAPETIRNNFVTKPVNPETNVLNKPPLANTPSYNIGSFDPEGHIPHVSKSVEMVSKGEGSVPESTGTPKVASSGAQELNQSSALERKEVLENRPPHKDVEPFQNKTSGVRDFKPKKWEHFDTKNGDIPPETLKIQGVYEEGSSVETELKDFLSHNTWIQKEYPDLSEVERGKIAYRLRVELMKDPVMAEKFKIHNGDWNTVWKNERYDISIDRTFIENEINKIHTPQQVGGVEPKQDVAPVVPQKVEVPLASGVPESEDIQDILKKNGFPVEGDGSVTAPLEESDYYKQHFPSQKMYPDITGNEILPETITMEGVYEAGSSVEKELQEFLKKSAWISKEYPGLSEAERNTVASLLRVELMKDPEMAEQFKIRGNDWTKVGVRDTYDVQLDRRLVESQIEKVRSIGKSSIAEVGKHEPEQQKVVLSTQHKSAVFPQKEVLLSDTSKRAVTGIQESPKPVEPEKGISSKKEASSFDRYAEQRREKLRIKMLEENKKYRPLAKSTVPETGKESATSTISPEQSPPRRIPVYEPKEEQASVSSRPSVQEAVRPKTLSQDLVEAGKVLQENKVDFTGTSSRGSLDNLIKNYNVFDTLVKAQRPVILSNWGPISYARMQDIFDGRGSISYTIGDEQPIVMGPQVERLTRSIVGQIERNLEKNIPNVAEVIAKAKEENWTLGELVKQLSQTLENQEKTSVPAIPTSEASTPLPQETSRIPITEYKRPALNVVTAEGKNMLVAKMVPIEVTEDIKKVVKLKYLDAHKEWLTGNAEALFKNNEATEFRYAVNLYSADIAADLSGGKIPIPSITIDWSAYKGMTPGEMLAQLEQHHKILSNENTTIPTGRVIEKTIFNSK
jgi:hypothetical protein